MNTTKPLPTNHFDPQDRQLILPQEPLVSSLDLGWQDFNFDYYEFGNYETPNFHLDHHAVC
ncbi:MAG: hypothetical protein AAF383_19890 [Cyanobacteria bacterium P01_A01_bin.83]